MVSCLGAYSEMALGGEMLIWLTIIQISSAGFPIAMQFQSTTNTPIK